MWYYKIEFRIIYLFLYKIDFRIYIYFCACAESLSLGLSCSFWAWRTHLTGRWWGRSNPWNPRFSRMMMNAAVLKAVYLEAGLCNLGSCLFRRNIHQSSVVDSLFQILQGGRFWFCFLVLPVWSSVRIRSKNNSEAEWRRIEFWSSDSPRAKHYELIPVLCLYIMKI